MSQLEGIEIKILSFKHKSILIGFIVLINIFAILNWSERNHLQAILSCLSSNLCFMYLWLRPEIIHFQWKNITPKKADGVMYVVIVLWVLSYFIPD
ncbi:hypothetical protein [Acinetobacter venetianus]|uniref:hypothetical protein n=1 Tax=Acinetobacter venetianus TaxID=52133 RepID=UPI00037AD2D0|nr:hypothetical protein [Acinetobacter venetianus]MCR4531912.1 hypothetical protein [Acinetobacter venetianus]MDA0696512.1 hypothetical protein [Pseudomonadota bacterium]MDA1254478.1 hypothetical protein [Pseudomonadota bacterium]